MLALVLSIAGLMAATPSVITNPDWMRTPSAEEMADHYPERARSAWLDGEATIVCRVSIKGRLNNCEVAVETPEGYGSARRR